jgi:hypothetical protein
MKRMHRIFILAAGLAVATAARADGHGPAYALATPTLAQGQWSSDTAMMDMSSDTGSAVSYREMAGYGITQDLTASFAFPVAQGAEPVSGMRATQEMMGGDKDLQGSLLWRFQRKASGIGERSESSVLFSAWDSRDATVDGLQAGQGMAVSAVTGHASRTTYWWLGAGVQHYLPDAGARLGDLYYVSAVWGWRPEYFRRDAPGSDWRLFVEALGESAQRDRLGGMPLAGTGGNKLLLGPSLLGLYGAWGVEVGALFPVAQDHEPGQPRERYRAKAVFTYWF